MPAFDAGTDGSIYLYGGVGIGVDRPIVYLFGVTGAEGLADPVDSLGLGHHFGIAVTLSVQPGIAGRLQQGAGTDYNGVSLEKVGPRVDNLDRYGAACQGVQTGLYGILIPGKVDTGSGGDVEVTIGMDEGAGTDIDLVGRGYVGHRLARDNRSETVRFRVDLDGNVSGAAGRNVDGTHTPQVGITHLHPGQILGRLDGGVCPQSRSKPAARKRDLIACDDII